MFHFFLSLTNFRFFPNRRLFPNLLWHPLSFRYLISCVKHYLYLFLYRLHNTPFRFHLSICLQHRLCTLWQQYLHTSFRMWPCPFLQNNNSIRLSTANLIKALPHWQFYCCPKNTNYWKYPNTSRFLNFRLH